MLEHRTGYRVSGGYSALPPGPTGVMPLHLSPQERRWLVRDHEAVVRDAERAGDHALADHHGSRAAAIRATLR